MQETLLERVKEKSLRIAWAHLQYAIDARAHAMKLDGVRAMKMHWEMHKVHGLQNRVQHLTQHTASTVLVRIMAEWAYRVCDGALNEWKLAVQRSRHGTEMLRKVCCLVVTWNSLHSYLD